MIETLLHLAELYADRGEGRMHFKDLSRAPSRADILRFYKAAFCWDRGELFLSPNNLTEPRADIAQVRLFQPSPR